MVLMDDSLSTYQVLLTLARDPRMVRALHGRGGGPGEAGGQGVGGRVLVVGQLEGARLC